MKKLICPYCGEDCITWKHKLRLGEFFNKAPRCPRCDGRLARSATLKQNRIRLVLLTCYLVLGIPLFFVDAKAITVPVYFTWAALWLIVALLVLFLDGLFCTPAKKPVLVQCLCKLAVEPGQKHRRYAQYDLLPDGEEDTLRMEFFKKAKTASGSMRYIGRLTFAHGTATERVDGIEAFTLFRDGVKITRGRIVSRQILD